MAHFYVWNQHHPEHARLIDAPTAEAARLIVAKASAQVAAPLCAWPYAYGHPSDAPATSRALLAPLALVPTA